MRTITWIKMVAAGGICCIGGPALIYYVTPTEEELFLKYNPELQRRSLERRKEKQEEFDHFVTNLKKYSGTDRHIWTEWEADVERKRAAGVQAELDRRREAERMKAEIKGSIK
ncbi:Assembly factor cbp4 [Fulvia fulva]|uniref:Cytochrome b mRNA-processing protein 4 n=1 Tax=Passalora fulva TaxID=5499 RepID=A0A9Q8L5J0_PASFU|nr:Assembly factor cbp4 [Fulvia fulva]KAK4635220.1 Assembly factor cbp4 [Fulvia fulva]KAK4638689.1 Assembly factor cbp4 [Fulvia fulva]UJO11275.1 Assembly factor cbp4 [Fulvia fulva]WPV08534.1 Assembly factor cbp4 [Fulvia fulva]WPV23647.1 Assembly factor cbp4 [Fulvia fulva]